MKGGCGCLMKGGVQIYGECPFKKNSFNCPYAQNGGRYGIDPAQSVGGNGPNVAPVTAHVPCEAYRPMPINPHTPTQLVSAPETGIHFAGLSPGAVLKGGRRTRKSGRKNRRNGTKSSKSSKRNTKHRSQKKGQSSLKGGEVNLVHTKFAAFTGVPISESAPSMPTNIPHTHSAPHLQTSSQQMYNGAPIMEKYPNPMLNGPKVSCNAPLASSQVTYTGSEPMDKYPQQVGGEHPLAYTAPRAGFSFIPNISQGQTLNPGQIPYQVVVPADGSDSASCGLTCGQAITQINKP
jgi:hypothetical protein